MGTESLQSKTEVAHPSTEWPLLDAGSVADALGTTRRHVQRLVAERRIPFLKVGRFVRFDQNEINRWLEEQRVEMRRPRRYGSSR
jgi:excisionase family DNA binding protein